MKNNSKFNKGSVNSILIAIIAVIVIVAVAYFFYEKGKSAQVVQMNQENNLIVTTSTTLSNQSSSISSTSPVLVSGMSQYTDSNFGFSFWYPSSMQVTKTQPQSNSGSTVDDSTIMNGPDTQILGVITAPEFTAYEVYSPNMSVLSSVDAGPFGSNYDKYFFDTQNHTWMDVSDGGPTGAAGGTTAADTTNNTMGGLHIFNGYTRFGYKVIIPLSAQNFLVIYAKCNDATDYTCEGTNGAAESALDRFKASVETIVATNPAVATPVSATQQTTFIQAEANAYAGQ